MKDQDEAVNAFSSNILEQIAIYIALHQGDDAIIVKQALNIFTRSHRGSCNNSAASWPGRSLGRSSVETGRPGRSGASSSDSCLSSVAWGDGFSYQAVCYRNFQARGGRFSQPRRASSSIKIRGVGSAECQKRSPKTSNFSQNQIGS